MKRLFYLALAAVMLLTFVGVAEAKKPTPPPPPSSSWHLEGTAVVTSTRGDLYNKVIEMTSRPDYSEFYGVTGGVVSYMPTSSLHFQDINTLSVDWKAVTYWGGGSPRFALAIDWDEDGQFNHWVNGGQDGWAFVYLLQQWPVFYDGPNDWKASGNLIGATEGIFDTTQLGGPTGYGNYDQALALLAGKPVLEIMLVVDGGWLFGWEESPDSFEQIVLANNVTVNNDVLTVSNNK